MRRYKNIVLICVSFLATAVPAEESLPSFERVRQQYRETNDLGRVSYLYRRCAALNLNVSAVLIRKKKKDAAQYYEDLANHYMLLSETVDKEVDQRLGFQNKQSMQTVSLAVSYLSEVYSRRMKDNQSKRGEYIAGDKVLEAELGECLAPEAFAKKLGR